MFPAPPLDHALAAIGADARAELEGVVDEAPNTPLSDQARQCLALLGSG